MAVKISNSLSDYLSQSMILQKNYLETLSKINDATISDKDFITLNIEDTSDNNVIHTYQIPSFGYLKKSIDRLDKTMRNIMNINHNSNSKIRLNDGTYRIVTATIPSDAKPINKVKPVTTFGVKSNWFFEDLLNPCLYISLDLTDQVDIDIQKVIVQRYIITCSTDNEKKDFSETYEGNTNIDYNTFIHYLNNNQHVNFIFDEDIRYIPPRNKKFGGTFRIMGSENISSDYNGDITKVYTLNKTTYTDLQYGTDRELVVNDILETCDSNYQVTARYRIKSINNKKVTLELIEGIAGLNSGKLLRIKSNVNDKVILDIPVGYNEREVIFIKPVDPISNIPAETWSKGVGFFTNNLTTDMFKDTDSDRDMKLYDFYKKHVVDFGQVILSYAKDYYPSIREGIKPNTPELIPSNFKVFCTNGHIMDESTKQTILDLKKRKDDISSKTPIQDIDEYKTILLNIEKITSPFINYTPSFSVKGAWEIPKPNKNQEVIGFKLKYRYIPLNDNTDIDTNTLPITTKDGIDISYSFSNWTEIKLKTRERVLDNKTGEYVWGDVDVDDADSVKYNECSIPIHPCERLEIQIKSLSEAGWPSNPMESDWSNTIVVDFDESLLEYENIQSIISQNRIDLSILKLTGK